MLPIVLGLLATTPLILPANSETGINERAARNTLGLNLAVRCQKWLKKDLRTCWSLSQEFARILDFEMNSEKKELIFFKSEFLKYASRPDVILWLKRLDFKLQMLSAGVEQEVDVYDLALQLEKTHSRSHQLLAILFQDTVRDYPILWLETQTLKDPSQKEFYFAFKQVHQNLVHIRKDSETFSRIKFYPPRLENEVQHFNQKIYYYYFPSYVAQKLKARFPQLNHLKLVQTLPVMASYIYKLHHSYKPTSRSATEILFKTFVYRPTPTLVQNQGAVTTTDPAWEYRYRDLYMAYLGSHSVSAESPSHLDPFDTFRKRLGLDPVLYLRSLSQEYHK